MSTSPLRAPKNVCQTIKYTGSATEFSTKIDAQDITIHCSTGTHNQGSSKIKLIDRIDYSWEMGFYPGQLIAAHINGKIIAYAIKGKEGGMVRVTNQETNQRALIKIPKNDIKDVAFAFSKQQIILGFVDEEGNVFIHEIIDEVTEIKYNLLLHIYHPNLLSSSPINYRIIWCPFIMNYDDEDIDSTDDPEKMFVVLNGSKAEIWNVGIINAKYGKNPIKPNENYDGYVEINHTVDLVDASFSSDGTAIAIACTDGYVKFFQIYMVDHEKQKCLHEWIPHDGKPLSSIIFVDNLLESSSQCWKFTITGANNNSELKLWSCESWTCLQTIHFQPNIKSPIKNLYLKISIDYSGRFLIISDMNNKLIYLLQLKRNDESREIYVTMLSQFLLPTRFLSFYIIEANQRQIPYSCIGSSNDDLYNNDDNELIIDDDDYDDDDSLILSIFIKMLVIQQKKFQECNILFQPETILCDDESSTFDNNKVIKSEKLPKLDDLQSSVTLLIQQQTNKSSKLIESSNDNSSNQLVVIDTNNVRNILNNDKNVVINNDTLIVDNGVENLIDFELPPKDIASGGSSPSREVQEILSLNNSTYSNQEYFDNLTKIQQQEEEEEEEEEQEVVDEEELPQKDYDDQTLNENLEKTIYNTTNSNNPETSNNNNNSNNEMIWPKIPLVKENDNNSDGGGGNNLDLKTINYRLNSLENAIREQNLFMQRLTDKMNKLLINNNTGDNNNATSNNNTKDEFNKNLDYALSKQKIMIGKMLESIINTHKTNELNQQELILTNITKLLNESLTNQLKLLLPNELKQILLPSVRNLNDSIKEQFDCQNKQKVNYDMVLKDNITKLLNGKALVDTLSNSIINVISPSLEKNYRDMISKSLIPTWEKVSNNMFKQINETFTQGTKEYTSSVESYMERQRNVQEKGKDLVTQMQTVSDKMQSTTDKLTNTISAEIHKQLTISFKHMQEVLVHNMKDIIKEQVNQGFKNHASVIEDSVFNAVRSRAVTPSSHVDTQITLAQIDQVLAKDQFNEAFQLALSAENLNFVIYLCEKVDSNKLFKCKNLSQPVLLALIQQLSVDLSKNSDVKLSFIRPAIISLSMDHPNTRQFVPQVLKELIKQLDNFMSTNSNSKFLLDAQLLKLAVERMVEK